MIGAPDSGLNITTGLYVGIAASTDTEVRRVLATVADHLFFFRGSAISPVKLADGLPSGALEELTNEIREKEKQPNQALQTTPMTRSIYEKTIEFGHPQRGV